MKCCFIFILILTIHFFNFQFEKKYKTFLLKKKVNLQHSNEVKIPKTTGKKRNKVNSQKIEMVL